MTMIWTTSPSLDNSAIINNELSRKAYHFVEIVSILWLYCSNLAYHTKVFKDSWFCFIDIFLSSFLLRIPWNIKTSNTFTLIWTTSPAPKCLHKSCNLLSTSNVNQTHNRNKLQTIESNKRLKSQSAECRRHAEIVYWLGRFLSI